MKLLLLVTILLSTLFLTGCPQGPSRGFPNDVNPKSGKTDTKSLVTNINHYLTDAQTNYVSALNVDPTDSNGKAKRIRNDAIEDAVAVINDNYSAYISGIESRRSKTDFLLDVVDLGLGAATAISKGERSNLILGVALTAFRGGRTSAELNFYKQQTTPILINKMDDNRATVLGDMLEKKDDSVQSYSLKGAIRDLVDFYNAGTLVRAFTELSKTTGAQALASQARVKRLSGPITVSSIPSLPVHQVLQQIDKQKISLAKQIQDAEIASPLPAAPAAAQLAARAQALQPVRLRLETIWKNIESNDKFTPAINTLKTQAAMNAILTKIATTPPTVTEREYLTLLFNFQAALNKDLDLNKELLGILMTVNP